MSAEGSVFNAQGKINGLSILTIDAYGVAVKNGFKGTVEEWLESLKGEKGESGSPILKDVTTGKTYELYIDNAKLMFKEVKV